MLRNLREKGQEDKVHGKVLFRFFSHDSCLQVSYGVCVFLHSVCSRGFYLNENPVWNYQLFKAWTGGIIGDKNSWYSIVGLGYFFKLSGTQGACFYLCSLLCCEAGCPARGSGCTTVLCSQCSCKIVSRLQSSEASDIPCRLVLDRDIGPVREWWQVAGHSPCDRSPVSLGRS